MGTENDTGDRDDRNDQRQQVYVRVNGDFHFLGHVLDALEQGDVQHGNCDQAADDRDAPEGLHRGVHHLDFTIRVGVAMLVYCWHRLHGHRVRNHVLHDVAGRREQSGDHEPGLNFHDLGHHLGVGNDRVHDPDTECDQTRAYIDENRFPAPDQVDQVTERHFQRPGDARPESQASEEDGGKIEILFDEKGTDDGGQS